MEIWFEVIGQAFDFLSAFERYDDHPASQLVGVELSPNTRKFLESKGLVQEWCDFESGMQQNTLREWCSDNGTKLIV